MMLIAAAMLTAACGEHNHPIDVKPAADPDDGLVSTDDRADRISNRYTSIVGTAEIGVRVEGTIDYPDWFHGYLVELEAGDEVRFRLTSGERSIVRLYGPARYVAWNGRPLFARHEVSEIMQPGGGSWATDFVYEPRESGLFLIVTGPLDVWSAKYDIELTCVGGGCMPQADTCQTNDDCEDGFCRFANAERTHMECVPYFGEGETCGGFVLPHTYQLCDPSLECVTRPYVADAPGTCRVRATVAELTAEPKAWVDTRVVIDGEVGHGPAFCTKMACAPDNPCCNQCGASQVVRDSAGDRAELDLRKDDGSSFGCSGNECTVADSCDLRQGPTRVLGTLRADQWGGHYFEVETITWLGAP
jgi:hypothetical protein